MKKNLIKKITVILSVILAVSAVVGVTYGIMSDTTDSITNVFDSGEVGCRVDETFDGDVKKDVKITNTKDVDVYIRAYVVVTWKNDAGEVYPVTPVAGTDYTISWGSTSYWDRTTSDGYYYHKKPVSPGKSTNNLITQCKPVANKAPDGYHLEVDIIAEAIQAKPSKAVVEAWGVTYNSTSGQISK